MAMRRFPTIVEWDAEDRVWVTYVPSLNHLSTYGETEAEELHGNRDLPTGTLCAILRQAGLTPDDLSAML
jgi:hypothetical protein